MNEQVRQFFRTEGESHFNQVQLLSEEKGLQWEQIQKTGISRAWFELSQLSVEDRIHFTSEFWLSRLPFHPIATPQIEEFFHELDDVVVALTRQTNEEPWRAELVYSLADNSCFFRGLVPANEKEIQEIQRRLSVHLPRDFLAFLHLHDGFGKLTELGLFPLKELEENRRRIINKVLLAEKPMDPYQLYPFYEDFGLEAFQCFHGDWYPGSEMGNVYFSGIDYTVSDVKERTCWAEQSAYPTFLEWLGDFLQGLICT
ncbi:MAG TPA: SMI1/KNR4 family protein [Chlamydiales bacterium]